MMRRNKSDPSFQNQVHTIVLIMAMAGLLSLMGWLLAGPAGVKAALVIAFIGFIFTPRVSPHFVMARLGARPVSPDSAPGLYTIAATLARRAGLETTPRLYYLPSRVPNAFAMGDRSDAGIAVTQGLAALLNTREMAGILSHEITHIQNNDTQVMAFSALFARLTSLLSFTGQILLVICLPLLLTGYMTVSLSLLFVMAFAPALNLLLFQALSRTREFEADMGAVTLLGDPRALASALSKVAAVQKAPWHRRLLPSPARPSPMMQSHPPTKERIRRLLAQDQTDPGGRHRIMTA